MTLSWKPNSAFSTCPNTHILVLVWALLLVMLSITLWQSKKVLVSNSRLKITYLLYNCRSLECRLDCWTSATWTRSFLDCYSMLCGFVHLGFLVKMSSKYVSIQKQILPYKDKWQLYPKHNREASTCRDHGQNFPSFEEGVSSVPKFSLRHKNIGMVLWPEERTSLSPLSPSETSSQIVGFQHKLLTLSDWVTLNCSYKSRIWGGASSQTKQPIDLGST